MARNTIEVILVGRDRLSGAMSAATRNAKQFTLAVTAAGAALGLFLKAGVSFQKEMNQVRAVTGALGKEFDALNKKAKDLGRSTAFTAKQAGEAMTALGRAGFTTNEILESVGDTLNLAAAGNVELGRAADITASTLRSFGLAADQAVSDGPAIRLPYCGPGPVDRRQDGDV